MQFSFENYLSLAKNRSGLEYFQPSNWTTTNLPDSSMILGLPCSSDFVSSAIVGVEIEVENIQHKEWQSITEKNLELFHTCWQSVEDTSLKNGGLEYVSVPLSISQSLEAIKFLYRIFPNGVSFSHRCGLHVHLNCLYYPLDFINKLLSLYYFLEPLFFDVAGNGRNKNIFCVPLQNTSGLKDIVEAYHQSKAGQKYSALNLQPLRKYGTIEFRHMPGTDSLEKIELWLRMIDGIVQFVDKYNGTYIDLLDDICELNTNSGFNVFCSSVFGPVWFDVFTKSKGFEKKLEQSIILIKASIFTLGTSTGPDCVEWFRKNMPNQAQSLKLKLYSSAADWLETYANNTASIAAAMPTFVPDSAPEETATFFDEEHSGDSSF